MSHDTQEELKKYIDNRTGNSHKRAIVEAIEQYVAKTRQSKHDDSAILHLIWAGD